MKTIGWMKVAMMFVASTFVFTACDDDDDKFAAPQAVQTAFNQQYGDATRVEWEREKNGYIVAEFWKDNKEYDAWYTTEGQWVMTEVDHRKDLNALPQAVREGFQTSIYSAWRVDDIDEIQRPNYTNIYKIEVEMQGQQDMDLYFDENGTLFREVTDGNDDRNEGMLPSQMPNDIQTFISERYPNARIVDIDRERTGYEVDIIYNKQSIEVLFDTESNWVASATDYDRNVPDVVKNAISDNYPGKRIDGCDFVETSKGERYWLVDIDNYNPDVRVSEDGKIIG